MILLGKTVESISMLSFVMTLATRSKLKMTVSIVSIHLDAETFSQFSQVTMIHKKGQIFHLKHYRHIEYIDFL